MNDAKKKPTKGEAILRTHDAVWDAIEQQFECEAADEALGERIFDVLDSQLDDWLEEVYNQIKAQRAAEGE